MMTIVYRVGKGLCVNLTNCCPCTSKFCIRQNGVACRGICDRIGVPLRVRTFVK